VALIESHASQDLSQFKNTWMGDEIGFLLVEAKDRTFSNQGRRGYGTAITENLESLAAEAHSPAGCEAEAC